MQWRWKERECPSGRIYVVVQESQYTGNLKLISAIISLKFMLIIIHSQLKVYFSMLAILQFPIRGSPLRYIGNLSEEMWNVGLQIQRLSLSEPYVPLGNLRASHWFAQNGLRLLMEFVSENPSCLKNFQMSSAPVLLKAIGCLFLKDFHSGIYWYLLHLANW
ncbi:uncharacterized protein LOC142632149 isoform X2 [Castanea sativa]|uniref:uncharacterized protein LOC142632149 isoform X2 n=1 Tax=Castanea sativa TaxID=21020 RepID=UPI003F64F362